MLTASVAGFQLWRDDIRLPTKLQWMGPAVAAFVMSVAGMLLYETVGRDLINPTSVLTAMSSRGFRDSQFLGFATYFVIVNATLEELFWRGVVLNELKGLALRQRSFGTWWTAASFGAWHYLVMRLLLRGFWPLVAAAFIMLCGIFLDLVYQRTRNILLAIVWHALVFDVPIILIFGIVLANSKG